MEFTEEDAVAFATLSEARKAEVRETCRLLEERSERLRQQSELLVQRNAALHQDIDTFKDELVSMGIKKLPARKVARAGTRKRHVCTCAPLDPVLWRTLPLDLLQLVFARLPLRGIIRLRVLSKTWDRYVTGVTPGFTKVCAETNPRIFGMLPPARVHHTQAALHRPTLYDIKSNRWHQFSHITMLEDKIETRRAGDGGLVCVVSTSKDQRFPLSITVFNPLTMQWRELPPHALSSVHPSMIQLVMDRESKSYKVIVVGPKDERGGGTAGAVVYSSVTRTWSSPKAFTDLIFGFQYNWNCHPFIGVDFVPNFVFGWATAVGPCAYDCGNDTLLELGELGGGSNYPWNAAGALCYAFVKDRLFVLHEEWCEFDRDLDSEEAEGTLRYYILEYQAQSCQPHWIKVREHQCSDEFEDPPCPGGYYMSLYAWEGFLLVKADNEERNGFAHERTWLYDLSTNKWQAILVFPHEASGGDDAAMFELRWDAAP